MFKNENKMELIKASKKIGYMTMIIGNLVGCGGDSVGESIDKIDESKTYIKSNVKISDIKNNSFNILSAVQQDSVVDNNDKIYNSESNFPGESTIIQLNFKQGDNIFSINVNYNRLTHKYNQISYYNESEKFSKFSGCVGEDYKFDNLFDKCNNLDFYYNEKTGELNINFKNTKFANKMLQSFIDSDVYFNGTLHAKLNYKLQTIEDFPKQSDVKLKLDGELLSENYINFDGHSVSFFANNGLALYAGWLYNYTNTVNYSSLFFSNSQSNDICSYKNFEVNTVDLIKKEIEKNKIILNFNKVPYLEQDSYSENCINKNKIKEIDGYIIYPKYDGIYIPGNFFNGSFIIDPYMRNMKIIDGDEIIFDSSNFYFKIKSGKVVFVSYKNSENYESNNEVVSYEYKCENDQCNKFTYDQSKNLIIMDDAELYLSEPLSGLKDKINISGEMVYIR